MRVIIVFADGNNKLKPSVQNVVSYVCRLILFSNEKLYYLFKLIRALQCVELVCEVRKINLQGFKINLIQM